MTCARIQWLNKGEKPTSFFCKLENKNFTEKTTRKLQTDSGTILTDQKVFLKKSINFMPNYLNQEIVKLKMMLFKKK